MKEIELTRGKVALVDDEDFEVANQFKWHASSVYGTDRFYAARKITGTNHNQFMHRLIMRPPVDMQVDHIDGDGLNNCRSNLRICTKSQNMGNMISRTNRHGFKGVSFHRPSGLYVAQIQRNGERRVTYRKTVIEAAHAYDEMAREFFGEFARVNFPLLSA